MEIKYFRKYCSVLYKGSIYVDENESLVKKDFSIEEQFKLLKLFCHLLMKTKFVSNETKLYLQNKELTYSDVCELTGINYNTFKNRLRLESKKISKYFPEIIETLITTKPNVEYLKILYNTTIRLIDKFKIDIFDLNDYLTVPIPKPEFRNKLPDLSDDSFDYLCIVISKISKKKALETVKTLSEDQRLYLHVLMNSSFLNKKERERKQRIINLVTD